MNTIKFKTADKLVEYCIDNNILAGQVWVDSNPYGDGERTLLWFSIDNDNELSTCISGNDRIEGVDYAYLGESWHGVYTGSFELVLPFTQFTKPEVYKVRDTVEVLENAREIGTWKNGLPEKHKAMIGNTYKIVTVYDAVCGIGYELEYEDGYGITFPHYCVKKVENPPKEMTLADIEQELGYKIKLIN